MRGEIKKYWFTLDGLSKVTFQKRAFDKVSIEHCFTGLSEGTSDRLICLKYWVTRLRFPETTFDLMRVGFWRIAFDRGIF